jgi:anti-sigma factor RsiW
MEPRIPSRDLELLSAYLDQQLSARQKSNLETRLAQNPGLQQALDALSQTRSLLRQAPQARPPRSFKLTPGLIGQAASVGRPFPVMRFVSAFASFLFIIVFASDILTGGGPAITERFQFGAGSSQAPMLAESDLAENESYFADNSAQAPQPAEEATEMAAEGAAAQDLAAGDEAVEPAPAADDGESADADDTAAESADGEAQATAQALLGLSVQGTSTAAPQTTQSARAGQNTTGDSADGEADANKAAQSDQELPEQSALESPLAKIENAASRIQIFRFLEISFAGIALITGAIAFYINRNKS